MGFTVRVLGLWSEQSFKKPIAVVVVQILCYRVELNFARSASEEEEEEEEGERGAGEDPQWPKRFDDAHLSSLPRTPPSLLVNSQYSR